CASSLEDWGGLYEQYF
nr:T-cell receptor V beta CDR3 region {clone V5IN3} [mice, NOD, islets, Peptide Partial, 16 aa] [Mus sp.]